MAVFALICFLFAHTTGVSALLTTCMFWLWKVVDEKEEESIEEAKEEVNEKEEESNEEAKEVPMVVLICMN